MPEATDNLLLLLAENGFSEIIAQTTLKYPDLNDEELKPLVQEALEYRAYYHKEDTQAMTRSLKEGLPVFDD